MKAKIDKYGHLWLERAGVMKLQECNRCPNSDKIEANFPAYYSRTVSIMPSCRPCGDWCPLFNIETSNCGQGVLSLCKKGYRFNVEDFTDERASYRTD